MNTQLIAVATITLLIGGIVGYGIGDHGDQRRGGQNDDRGAHLMADGQMMRNDDHMSMADMMAGMNENLRAKNGNEFDKAFLEEMIVHHQGAVEMAMLARTNAAHQEIKDLAEAIIAAQNKEIADMEAWQRQWFGEDSTE